MNVASLFSGCGGMDLGFVQAGFRIIYANDIDKDAIKTYEKNFGLKVDRRSILEVPIDEIPSAEGIIGGPPCQSWSLAGAMKGENDPRGKLFFYYANIIKIKQPKFFVAENVPGLVSSAHINSFKKLISMLGDAGYNVSWKVLDARDYGVPQERKRVFIVGIKKGLGVSFQFPEPLYSKYGMGVDGKHMKRWLTLRDAIGDLPEPRPALPGNKPNQQLEIPNHEYMVGSFSPIYMSRNRRMSWDEQSYTIQAGGRHAPLHPSSCPMRKICKDKWEFTGNYYRRISIREAARIQGFPDSFIFVYNNVADGYKLVGNAVPPPLAMAIAVSIKEILAGKIIQGIDGEDIVGLERNQC